MLAHKSVQAKRQMWIGRKAAANTHRKTNFGICTRAANCGKSNIIDLGIGAPHAAACDANFEFTWQIVEIAVPYEKPVGLKCKGRGVKNFVGIHTSQRAPGNVA